MVVVSEEKKTHETRPETQKMPLAEKIREVISYKQLEGL